MGSNRVSIITVNFNSEDQIIECLNSIEANNSSDIEYIIVSNSKIESRFKERLNSFSFPVKLYQNEANFGFAKGCNIGAEKATGDYLFFLNPDTLFLNDTVTELLKCISSTPEIFVAGPKTFLKKDKVSGTVKEHISLRFFFYFMTPLLKFFIPPQKIGGHYNPDSTKVVPVLNGHAFLIESKRFFDIGKMEEHFFMYWEENDLCLRVQKKGGKVLYCSQAQIMHHKGFSTNPVFIKMEVEKHRSRKKFVEKHYPQWKTLNRISGIIGYSWRALGSFFTLNAQKISQHWRLFFWYIFEYK